MSEIEQASKLIGDIYDAALDPGLWPEVLHTTCDFVEGCAATLSSQHSAPHSVRFFSQWGTDPSYTKLYQEKYVKLNPGLVPLVMTLGARPNCLYARFRPAGRIPQIKIL
jgi:hypothetical protein